MPKTKAKSFWFQTPWRHHKQHKYASFERNVKKKKEKDPQKVAVRTRSAKVHLFAGVEACTVNVQKNIDGLQIFSQYPVSSFHVIA